MKISYLSAFEDWSSEFQTHLLTYAEEGFAPLNFHAKRFQIEREVLVKFENEVNFLDQTGTLFPLAPISAVPRRLIRDEKGHTELSKYIHEFLAVNSQIFLARRVVFDFVTSHLSPKALTVIERTLNNLIDTSIDEFVIVTVNGD